MENTFTKLIFESREKELYYLKKMFTLIMLIVFFNWFSPSAGCAGMYWVYLIIHKKITIA